MISHESLPAVYEQTSIAEQSIMDAPGTAIAEQEENSNTIRVENQSEMVVAIQQQIETEPAEISNIEIINKEEE